MNELSLFSGAGGGLLGSLLLGWTPKGYVENNDYCQRVIAQRIRDGILPAAPIFGDVKAFIRDGYAASYQGMVDVVTAGFPCQPFSNAGRRKGESDDRNRWPETIEVIRQVRPRFCFMENVRGLLSSGYFQEILKDLAESGYDARWRLLSAAEVGAPHQRERLWILAYTRDAGSRVDSRGTSRSGGQERQSASTPQSEMVRQEYGKDSAERTGTGSGDVSDAQQYGDGWRQQSAQGGQRERNIYNPSWWEAEPELGRLADGIPNRINRLKAAGNAQVPAVVRAAWELLSGDYDE